MGEETFCYEASLAPDGRVQSLIEDAAGGAPRPIAPESSEGVHVLARGRGVLYRFDEERRLRDLAHPDVLEAMRREIHLTLHKVSHGELLDEPELVPVLRRLLADLEATTAFQEAWGRFGAGA